MHFEIMMSDERDSAEYTGGRSDDDLRGAALQFQDRLGVDTV